MKYFFQLGSNQALSIAEIEAVFFELEKKITIVSEEILILETSHSFDPKELIERMGGTIKIGEIKSETKNIHPKNVVKESTKFIETKEGKFKFGVSYYGTGKMNTKTIGMEIKKHFKEGKGMSCRWVTSKEKTLSSVVVEQNKLIDRGVEIVLIKDKHTLYIAKTLAVQAFKKLSRRDFGRPARDDKSGMLPPKLAQIMINLGRKKPKDTVLLDPFCGSGTVINEAMLMGYKELIASDKSKKAIDDTKENFEWLYKNNSVKKPKIDFFELSALELSKKIPESSVDLIVTEPYLGPQRGRVDFNVVKNELEELYSKALEEFQKILKPDGRIVMIFPVFLNKIFINPLAKGFKRAELLEDIETQTNKRASIVYGREGQKVWREIVVFEKENA